MKRLLCSVMIGLGIFASQAHASITDITDEFETFVKERFIGASAEAEKVWDHTGKICIFEECYISGNTIEAWASATVTRHLSSLGTVEMAADPFNPADKLVRSSSVMKFEYRGDTRAHRYYHPGKVFVDVVWGGLQPSGDIVVKFISTNATNYQVHISYKVYPGHGDRPNAAVAAAAEVLKHDMRQIVENFLALQGIKASVYLM